MSGWENAKMVLQVASPVGWLVAESVEKAAKSVAKASAQGVDQLTEELAKQTLQLTLAEQQARIAQELAIGRRIDNAEEVEIEEFYEASGKGHAGASLDVTSKSASLGLAAEGRRVTKRIYRFKGWRSQDDVIVSTTG